MNTPPSFWDDFNFKFGIFNMKIIKLTCALLLSAWVSSANATLIFDFSFEILHNGGWYNVTGEIIGLNDNATGAASSVRIITNSGGFGVGEYALAPYSNEFTVNNQVMTSALFNSIGMWNVAPAVTDSSLAISFDPTKMYIGLSNRASGVTDIFHHETFQLSLRSIDVPEPGTVILLSLGLAGLSFSRYRRQS